MSTLLENNLEITLEGLGLEKYLPLLNERHIKFDTFVNMTKEELISIGITDENDLTTILQGVEPLRQMFFEINNLKPPDTEAILGNTLHHIKELLAVMIFIKKNLLRNMPEDVLIDPTHTASEAIINLLSKIDDEIANIREDLADFIEEPLKKPKKCNSLPRSYYIIGCLAVVAVTSFVILKFGRS